MEKKNRTKAKSDFTRSEKTLRTLIDNNSQSFLVTEQFEKLKICFQKLEDAQDAFLGVTEIDIEEDANGLKYMDGPSDQYDNALTTYSAYLRTSEDTERNQLKKNEEDDLKAVKEVQQGEIREKLRCEKAKLETAIDTFGWTNDNIEDSLAEASDSDKRKEWQRVETEYESLKSQLLSVISMDPAEDSSPTTKKFKDVAEKTYNKVKKWMMSQLKDSVEEKTSVSRGSERSFKTEKVSLPKFKGDEKESPYLKYPIWKKQWDSLISHYDEAHRDRLLFQQVDDVAKSKFIGYESNYEEAMKRLDSFYGGRVR